MIGDKITFAPPPPQFLYQRKSVDFGEIRPAKNSERLVAKIPQVKNGKKKNNLRGKKTEVETLLCPLPLLEDPRRRNNVSFGYMQKFC